MPLFRKKPIAIVADRWFKNGDHPEDHSEKVMHNGEIFLTEGKVVGFYIRNMPSGTNPHRACEHCCKIMEAHGWIETLEGGHIVCPGDWVITGVKGERYPCKPDVFDSSYEPVE